MALWRTDCGCTQEVGLSQKRKKVCDEHGHLFVRVREDGTAVAGRPIGKEPRRDWTDAIAKVADEGCCRICKRTDRKLEAAHVLGREHDEPKIGAGGKPLKELYVDPDRILPLCGPFPEGCHGDVDHNRVNLVHHLTIAEQVQAVKDAGGIAPAWVKLAPVGPREDAKVAA